MTRDDYAPRRDATSSSAHLLSAATAAVRPRRTFAWLPRLETNAVTMSYHANWTTNQRLYERALRDGPTAALERFRTACLDRSPGLLSRGDEVVELAEVLDASILSFAGSHGATLEMQRALTENDIATLLLDIMA